MATLTYANDIAPHLERSLRFRRLRKQRWQVLHPQYHGFCDEDEYDPYRWAKTDRTVWLFFGVIALLCYEAGCEIIAWLRKKRPGRSA